MRTAIIGLLLLSATACSATQRVTVGAGVAGVGLAVTTAAVASMAGCQQLEGQGSDCASYKRTSPGVAIPVALGGLGVAVLGGVIMTTPTQGEAAHVTTSAAPELPEEPTELDKTDAVGMAVAQLVLDGMDGDSRPRKLLDVDDTQSSVHVAAGHAELRNLRAHFAENGTWLTLGACFEYENGWHVTALGTAPGCSL